MKLECSLLCAQKNLFLIEDDRKELCGYITAVPDNKNFMDRVTEQWMPNINKKYENKRELYCMNESEDWKLPTSSHLIMKLSPKVHEECSFKRILNSVLSVLKTSGATTVYYRLANDSDFELMVELGFFPVSDIHNRLLWRSL